MNRENQKTDNTIARGWYDIKSRLKKGDAGNRDAFFAGAEYVLQVIYTSTSKDSGHFRNVFNSLLKEIREAKL